MIILREKFRLLRYIKLPLVKDPSYRLMAFIHRHIRGPGDIITTNSFFMKLYDELYHEIVFKKLRIQKKVLRIFEALASPMEEQNERETLLLFAKIKQIRNELLRENFKNY